MISKCKNDDRRRVCIFECTSYCPSNVSSGLMLREKTWHDKAMLFIVDVLQKALSPECFEGTDVTRKPLHDKAMQFIVDVLQKALCILSLIYKRINSVFVLFCVGTVHLHNLEVFK